jgi:phenylpyruvate tautomerase PptA (4-oxalocrotonate tautomerase family)
VPLLEIHCLPLEEGADVAAVLRRVTAAVADAIGARPEAVWATWSTIDGGYAVAGDVRDVQSGDSHAPIVHVRARRSAAEIDAICAAVERVLVADLGLAAGNVFVTVAPVQSLDPSADG